VNSPLKVQDPIEDSRKVHQPLVLVVDDEQSIRNSLSGVLEDENYRTVTAEDGPSALDIVEQFSPDLVFLDIWMPGWDGIETLEKIKKSCPSTQVIMISGHATISNALEATRRGAFDFIEKPLDLEGVVLSAKRALETVVNPGSGKEKGDMLLRVATPGLPLLNHAGILSTGLKGRNLGQRTLASSTILYGQCLHSGNKSGLVLEPLPKDSGIHFARIGGARSAPAFVDYVESTGFATTIRVDSVSASTIEHLLAALHAYGISNLLIKCNDEVPIFDGSSLEFCKTIERVGIEEQGGDWYEIAPDKKIEFVSEDGNETITLEPSDHLEISYYLKYPAPVGEQEHSFKFDGAKSFLDQIAPARTFGFMKDIEALQKVGLAAGGRLDNFILIGDDQVINTDLRFPDELSRHKILDIMGDLFLIGRPLRAKISARMTGHFDNIEVLKLLKSGSCS